MNSGIDFFYDNGSYVDWPKKEKHVFFDKSNDWRYKKDVYVMDNGERVSFAGVSGCGIFDYSPEHDYFIGLTEGRKQEEERQRVFEKQKQKEKQKKEIDTMGYWNVFTEIEALKLKNKNLEKSYYDKVDEYDLLKAKHEKEIAGHLKTIEDLKKENQVLAELEVKNCNEIVNLNNRLCLWGKADKIRTKQYVNIAKERDELSVELENLRNKELDTILEEENTKVDKQEEKQTNKFYVYFLDEIECSNGAEYKTKEIEVEAVSYDIDEDNIVRFYDKEISYNSTPNVVTTINCNDRDYMISQVSNVR